jgi:hypothetical protein
MQTRVHWLQEQPEAVTDAHRQVRINPPQTRTVFGVRQEGLVIESR